MRTPPRLYLRLPEGVAQPKVVGTTDEGETT
jgi:cell division protein FtsQ